MTGPSSPLQLEDFGKAAPASSAAPIAAPLAAEGQLEGGNLDAFEQGYRSGWDDCIANEQEERRRIGAGLEAAIKAIATDSEEIRQDLLLTLSPLLEQIATQLLPAAAAEAVAPRVVEELLRIAEGRATKRVELLAAPDTCPIIESLADGVEGLEIDIIPEPAMAAEQVSLRFTGQRRDIDLSDAVARMADALRTTAAEMAGLSKTAAAPNSTDSDPLVSDQKGVA